MRTISVPIQLINLQEDNFHLLVEIVVFGQKHFAVLDTGASRSVFDTSLLEQHVPTLEVVDDMQASTIFSSSSSSQGTIPILKIGKLTLKNYPALGLDLQGVSNTYVELGQPPIAGIIGGDILAKFNAKIDYKNKVLRLYK